MAQLRLGKSSVRNPTMIGGEDAKFVSELVSLVQALDAIAVDERIRDNEAARNCATAAASLRRWLDELGMGPHVEPLS